jgi:hypothetical protein
VLIHALFATYGLPKVGLTEEDVCSKLEVPLAILIRDNPMLMADIDVALRGNALIVT